jgi:hypothetical protein
LITFFHLDGDTWCWVIIQILIFRGIAGCLSICPNWKVFRKFPENTFLISIKFPQKRHFSAKFPKTSRFFRKCGNFPENLSLPLRGNLRKIESGSCQEPSAKNPSACQRQVASAKYRCDYVSLRSIHAAKPNARGRAASIGAQKARERPGERAIAPTATAKRSAAASTKELP